VYVLLYVFEENMFEEFLKCPTYQSELVTQSRYFGVFVNLASSTYMLLCMAWMCWLNLHNSSRKKKMRDHIYRRSETWNENNGIET
jgi:hypothetical protein